MTVIPCSPTSGDRIRVRPIPSNPTPLETCTEVFNRWFISRPRPDSRTPCRGALQEWPARVMHADAFARKMHSSFACPHPRVVPSTNAGLSASTATGSREGSRRWRVERRGSGDSSDRLPVFPGNRFVRCRPEGGKHACNDLRWVAILSTYRALVVVCEPEHNGVVVTLPVTGPRKR